MQAISKSSTIYSLVQLHVLVELMAAPACSRAMLHLQAPKLQTSIQSWALGQLGTATQSSCEVDKPVSANADTRVGCQRRHHHGIVNSLLHGMNVP